MSELPLEDTKITEWAKAMEPETSLIFTHLRLKHPPPRVSPTEASYAQVSSSKASPSPVTPFTKKTNTSQFIGLPTEIELQIFQYTRWVGNILEVFYDGSTLQAKNSAKGDFRIFSPLEQSTDAKSSETKKERYAIAGDLVRIFTNMAIADTEGGMEVTKVSQQDHTQDLRKM
jgi:hypothetical protein